MPATEAQLCNLALAKVGHRQFIDSLKEPSLEAQICDTLYPATRDACLALHPWPFATRHALLAELPTARDGWAYAYALPQDFVAARYLFVGVRPGAVMRPLVVEDSIGVLSPASAAVASINGAAPVLSFELEADDSGNGQILVTDQPNASLVYTYAVVNVPAMPILFQKALATALAAELAGSLKVDPALAAGLEQRAERELDKAWGKLLNEQQADPQPDSSFIAVRG